MSARTRARDFYARQRRIVAAAVVAVRNQVRAHPDDVTGAVQVMTRYQLVSAAAASRAMAKEAGRDPLVQPQAFAGINSGGYPLETPMATLLEELTRKIEENAGELTREMLEQVDRMVGTEVGLAGVDAAGIEIALEPEWTNYVRVLNPPSCGRCAILAGRIYRDNDGFLRHPLCDCVHWPVSGWEQAVDEGLLFSARDAFNKGQVTGVSSFDAWAIADGADPSQVINAAQGMQTASIFGRNGVKITTAGTTKQSAWRRAHPDLIVRLRPQSIYELAKDRDDEIRLLKTHGYIAEDADVPTRNGDGAGGGSEPPPAPPAPDPDDGQPRYVIEAADSVMDNARQADADQVTTKHVRRAATASRGRLERLETRFKPRASVVEKLIRTGTSREMVELQAANFNDGLRYSIVLDDDTYWADVQTAIAALNERGYTVTRNRGGWNATGYQGLNLTVSTPDGIEFEVQLHTVSSLAASEATHDMYEEKRQLPGSDPRRGALQTRIDELYAAVPLPPGVPRVS